MGAASNPTTTVATEITLNSPSPVPSTRRIASTSRRPMCWPIRIVVAIPNPNTAATSRNMMILALVVAASALCPRNCPIQTALIEPLSDCRIDEPSVGSANSRRVRAIGPSVRLR